jgi:hypothetical protein
MAEQSLDELGFKIKVSAVLHSTLACHDGDINYVMVKRFVILRRLGTNQLILGNSSRTIPLFQATLF